jgi:hypothetical protein
MKSGLLSLGVVVSLLYLFEGYLQHRAALTLYDDEQALFAKTLLIQKLRDDGRVVWGSMHPRAFVSPKTSELARMFTEIETDRGIRAGDGYILPLGAISRTDVVLCREDDGDIIYPADEHGFRNPHDLWREGEVDIMAVGDSFTQGACVADGDHLVDVIRRRIPATLNLGSGSNGPILELAGLREYGHAIRPRVVVWFFFDNDYSDIGLEFNSAILRRYLEEPEFSQGLHHRQAEIDAALMRTQTSAFVRILARWKTKSKEIVRNAVRDTILLRQIRHRILSAFTARPDADQSPSSKGDNRQLARILIERTFEQARTLVQSWGGTLVVVHLPAKSESLDEQKPSVEALAEICRKLDLPLLALHETFFSRPDVRHLFPVQGGHYSAAGHALVGNAVARWIADKEWLQPK